MATTGSAQILYMEGEPGTFEHRKFADIIGFGEDPLQDATEMQRAKFVMKGGQVIRNDFARDEVSDGNNRSALWSEGKRKQSQPSSKGRATFPSVTNDVVSAIPAARTQEVPALL